MQDDARVDAAELRGAQALREWITGERAENSRVFLIDSGAPVDGVAEVAGDDDVVLLPSESGPYEGPASAIHYSGVLCDVGDELFFGERGVELQDYVAAAFVQIVGPTAVCLVDASSWRAFLDDAELARHTGVFPSALIDPRVLLAGRSALANPGELETPSALRVSADGRVSAGVRGEDIGSVDEIHAVLTTPVPPIAALGGIASRETLAAELRSREWIGRYLNATDLLKMLRLANGAAAISGFGWFLLDDGLADDEPLAADPFLLETADGFVLADVKTLRRQLLSPSTATVVAATQTSHTSEVAAERVARHLGMPAPEAMNLCLEAVSALNIHFGRRSEAPCLAKGIQR